MIRVGNFLKRWINYWRKISPLKQSISSKEKQYTLKELTCPKGIYCFLFGFQKQQLILPKSLQKKVVSGNAYAKISGIYFQKQQLILPKRNFLSKTTIDTSQKEFTLFWSKRQYRVSLLDQRIILFLFWSKDNVVSLFLKQRQISTGL